MFRFLFISNIRRLQSFVITIRQVRRWQWSTIDPKIIVPVLNIIVDHGQMHIGTVREKQRQWCGRWEHELCSYRFLMIELLREDLSVQQVVMMSKDQSSSDSCSTIHAHSGGIFVFRRFLLRSDGERAKQAQFIRKILNFSLSHASPVSLPSMMNEVTLKSYVLLMAKKWIDEIDRSEYVPFKTQTNTNRYAND